MSEEFMLTTIDNPFNPFEDFNQWFLYDVEKGYNSSSRLARIVNLTEDMSEAEINAEIERAIDEIIYYDFLGIYMKIKRSS